MAKTNEPREYAPGYRGIYSKTGERQMKKTWIKVKRGLLEPAHRDRIGIRIWLYLHILDYTDWDTGTIIGWKDAEHAELLEMPHRTLQEQRQRLAEDGYISCARAFQSLTVTINNWTNPR